MSVAEWPVEGEMSRGYGAGCVVNQGRTTRANEGSSKMASVDVWNNTDI
jgi:hypothetical protein